MTDNVDRLVGRNIRNAREVSDLTQRDLAERLAARGWKIDPTALTRIEKGERSLRLTQLALLADALDVDIAELLEEDRRQLDRMRREVHDATRGARAYLVRAVEAVEQVWQWTAYRHDGQTLLEESGLRGVRPDDYPRHVVESFRRWVESDARHARATIMSNADERIRDDLSALIDAIADVPIDVYRFGPDDEEAAQALQAHGAQQYGVDPDALPPIIGAVVVG